MNGVIDTLPGFLAGKEVVAVTYDPQVISYKELMKKSVKAGCATQAFTRTDEQQEIAEKILGARAVRNDNPVKPDKKPRYYLSKSVLRFVPMTSMQAMRVNGRLKSGSHLELLSPSQRKLLRSIQAHPDAEWKSAIGKDITKAWAALPK